MAELSSKIKKKSEAPQTRVGFAFSNEKVKRINTALSKCGEEEARHLMAELLELWMGAIPRNEEMYEEAISTFGEAFEKNGEDHISRLLYTLTADGRQMRVWNGVPAGIGNNHAESAGKHNLLVEVKGDPKEVKKYLQILQEEVEELEEVELSNGSSVFLPVRHDYL